MNSTWHRLTIFACCLLIAQTAVADTDASAERLRVGIRMDAKPFVYE